MSTYSKQLYKAVFRQHTAFSTKEGRILLNNQARNVKYIDLLFISSYASYQIEQVTSCLSIYQMNFCSSTGLSYESVLVAF